MVRLICWNPDLALERAAVLEKAGFEVDSKPVPNGKLVTHIRLTQPSAVVIDLDRLPSQGRTVGVVLRTTKSTRMIPLVFLGGEPGKVELAHRQLPDAFYGPWPDAKRVLRAAMSTSPSKLVTPKGPMEQYAGSSLEKKLGLKPGMRVAILGAPADVEFSLDLTLEPRPGRNTELVICFIRSMAELEREVEFLAIHAPLWIAFPKQSSGLYTDFTQHDVRRVAKRFGMTDNKICAVNATWSAMRFTHSKNIS